MPRRTLSVTKEEKTATMTLQEEQGLNQRSYRRLRKEIDEMYPKGHYVAIVRGKVVADAPAFRQLIGNLESIEADPDRRLIIQAGVEYPKETVVLC